MYIAVDFDGTCVEHRYPYVGIDCDGAERVLKSIVENGNKLILLTMRGTTASPQTSGKTVLDDAVQWFADKDIPLYAVNSNPSQGQWTDSNKVYANIYIDDAALGCPLNRRGFVDWDKVEKILKINNII